MPGPGPLSAASGVRTSGDGDGRKLRIRQGDSRRQRTPPRYAEAGTGTYDIITRYRMCITYRSGVNGVRRNYVLRARRRVNRRGEPGSFENEKNKSVSTIPFITGRE